MFEVTNHGRAPEHFRVKGGGIESVGHRETKKLDLANRDSVSVTSREAAGLITVSGKAPAKPKAETKANAPSGIEGA